MMEQDQINQIIIAFLLAIITFSINQRLHKIIKIKILVNTIFELYGYYTAINEHNSNEASNRLMDEIIEIEKMYDNNKSIKEQVNKLIKLRMIYFKYSIGDDFSEKIKEIQFKKLGTIFIILSFINIKPWTTK